MVLWTTCLHFSINVLFVLLFSASVQIHAYMKMLYWYLKWLHMVEVSGQLLRLGLLSVTNLALYSTLYIEIYIQKWTCKQARFQSWQEHTKNEGNGKVTLWAWEWVWMQHTVIVYHSTLYYSINIDCANMHHHRYV